MSDSKYLVTSVKVRINAPASLVWDVLVDLDSYPEWNLYTVRVESALKMGAPVNLFLPNPGQPGKLVYVIEHLTTFDRPRQLSWEMSPSEHSADAARCDQYIEATGVATCTYFYRSLLGADRAHRDGAAWGMGASGLRCGCKQPEVTGGVAVSENCSNATRLIATWAAPTAPDYTRYG